MGDVKSRAVAEHTLMLMLSAARRTVAFGVAVAAAQNILDFFDGKLDRKLIVNADAIGLGG